MVLELATNMNTRGRKAKGRKFQQFIRDVFRNKYVKDNKLSDEDIESRGMGQQGTDIIFSPLAQQIVPYDIECKNCEQWNVPAWWKQTKDNTKEGRKPLLFIKKNRHDPIVVMSLEDFLELI